MKKVKMATSDSYHNYLVESLKDSEEAAAYIEAILEVENPEPQLLSSALNDVIDAIKIHFRYITNADEVIDSIQGKSGGITTSNCSDIRATESRVIDAG